MIDFEKQMLDELLDVSKKAVDTITRIKQAKKEREEKSKQSKEDRGWEVVKLEIGNTGVVVDVDKSDGTAREYKIHSVRRLSDSEVFSTRENTLQGVIKSFCNQGGHMIVYFDNCCPINLIGLQKVAKPKPLFTTTNGVDMFIGGVYWYVDERFVAYATVIDSVHDIGKGIVTFSSYSAAEEYIMLNKPLLSVNDVMGFYRKNFEKHSEWNPSHGTIRDNMIEIAKSKLNQK